MRGQGNRDGCQAYVGRSSRPVSLRRACWSHYSHFFPITEQHVAMTVNNTEVTVLAPGGHRCESCGFPPAFSLGVFLSLSTREPGPFQGSFPHLLLQSGGSSRAASGAWSPRPVGAEGLAALEAAAIVPTCSRVLSCVFSVPSFLISVDCNLLCLIYYLNLITTLS